MTFLEAAQAPLRKYFVFSGRSSRKEFWSFALALAIAEFGAVLAMVMLAPVFAVLFLVLLLGALIPQLTVTVRRLHDTNRTGWWYLITLIPYVGAFILLYFLVLASDQGANQYGPNPYGHAGEQAFAPAAPSGDGWVTPKG